MIRRWSSNLAFALWSAVTSVLKAVWSMLRPGIRFLGSLMLVAAVIALTSDVTRWQTAGKGPVFASLEAQISKAAPATLEGIGKTIAANFHPLAWDPLLLTFLALPAWLALLILALALNYGARERRQPDIFIN